MSSRVSGGQGQELWRGHQILGGLDVRDVDVHRTPTGERLESGANLSGQDVHGHPEGRHDGDIDGLLVQPNPDDTATGEVGGDLPETPGVQTRDAGAVQNCPGDRVCLCRRLGGGER